VSTEKIIARIKFDDLWLKASVAGCEAFHNGVGLGYFVNACHCFHSLGSCLEPCAKDEDLGCSVHYCELSEVTGAGRSSSFSVPISVVASHRRHDQRVPTAETLSQELYKTDGEER
jgi:hypothetical protein